jgi:hypothetical protein
MQEILKSYEAVWKGLGEGAEVTEAQLALINRYALEPLTAEQVYVRRMRLCNDQPDRSYERFPEAYLKRFAATLPGKSFLGQHDRRSFALGRFFEATVEKEDGITYLVPSFYMVRLAANEEARGQIDGGVWSHVSIGARVDKRLCDLCGKDYDLSQWDGEGNFLGCKHLKGREYNGKVCTITYGGDLQKVEALEGSIVWLGAQYGAEMAKDAGGGRSYPDKEAMLMEKGIVDTPPAELLAQLEAARKATETVTGERDAALAEVGTLKAERDVLAVLVTDGKLYREDLRAEMQRLAGCVGAEKECEAILQAGAEVFTAARLKELVGEYQARFEKAFPPSGSGEPAQSKQESPRPGAPRSHSVI